jgi:DNA-binding MarR family transcriptional regulator
MVKRLEKLGFVVRRSSTRSRRGRAIFITAAGQAWLAGARTHLGQANATLLDRLTPDEQRRLHELLSKMLGLRNSYWTP